MKKLLALAILLTLGIAADAWAIGKCPTMVSTTTPYRCVAEVFNDSGSTLSSGSVVIWDNDDTEFDRNGYPYVTTTTTADDDWVAGVMLTDSCTNQTFCEIVTYGWAWTLIADSTDAVAEDTLVGTSTVSGQAGDYGTGANTCALGKVTELRDRYDAVDDNLDGQVFAVWVDVDCN